MSMDAGLSIPGVLPRAIALGLFAALCAFPLKAQTLRDDFQKGLERDDHRLPIERKAEA